MKKKVFGFTLAEVLITLGIIGVVAAITIPTMMNSIQDNQFKVAYKKAYSVASQAWEKAYTDYLLTPNTAGYNDPANDDNFKAFKSEFSVVKDCSGTDVSNCWTNDGYKWDTNYPNTTANSFIDKSGMVWAQPVAQHVFVFVDTNGDKKPNDWGKDRFCFVSDGTKGKITLIDDGPAGTASCPNTKHDCYYQSWITGAK